MNTQSIYWVRRYGTEKWSVAELGDDGWLMLGAAPATKTDLHLAEIGEQITIPLRIDEGTQSARSISNRAE